MSVQEIIAELTKLKPDELILVKAKVDGLARTKDHFLHGTPLKIHSIQGHRVLTPNITQAELAEELFGQE